MLRGLVSPKLLGLGISIFLAALYLYEFLFNFFDMSRIILSVVPSRVTLSVPGILFPGFNFISAQARAKFEGDMIISNIPLYLPFSFLALVTNWVSVSLHNLTSLSIDLESLTVSFGIAAFDSFPGTDPDSGEFLVVFFSFKLMSISTVPELNALIPKILRVVRLLLFTVINFLCKPLELPELNSEREGQLDP